LQAIIETAVDGIITIDERGTIRSINPAGAQIFGYTADEVVGRNVNMLMPTPYHQNHDQYLRNYLSTGVKKIIGIGREMKGQRKDKTIFPVELAISEIRLKERRLFTGIVRDITERKEAEQALRQSVEHFRLLFDLAPIGMALTSLEGRILHVNQAFCETLGYTAESLQDLSFPDITHPDDKGASHRLFQQLLKLETSHTRLEKRYISKRGELIYAILQVTLMYDEQGQPLHFISQIVDITEQKRTEVVLQQAHEEEQRLRHLAEEHNKELDAFARTVAHDIKSPLGVVVGYADYLVELFSELETVEILKVLKKIRGAGQKGANIVEELLLLAGVRKQKVNLRPLRMEQVVQQAQERLDFMISEYQGEIELSSRPAWPMVLGYAPWLQEVWANYLSNGLKYGGWPPRLTLGAAPQSNGMIRFWVQDNGPGLTPEAQGLLFTEFTRLEELRAEGHGLGLSIVRRIVEKLGGEVGVESTLGQGSVFYFTLPAVEKSIKEA
jgi:PAS domain S-box-containing protein